jgi:Arylsulfotransferase (ASST)
VLRPAPLVRRVSRLTVPAALSVLAAGVLAAPAAAKLTISPAPGTPDVSPQTQISILGVAPSRIASVSVDGAASGAHPGALRRYSRGRGASFVPAQPLAQGERVAVVVRLHARAPVRFSFTVARLAPIQPVLQLDRTQPAKLQAFVSRPDLTPPRIAVHRRSPSRGGVFITPLPSPVVHPESNNAVTISPVGPGGPMIVDGHGDLVWFQQLRPPDVAANLRLQRYAGRPVLTWWQGGVTPSAFGLGVGVIADTSYRTLRTVRAGNGYPMDIHEFELAPTGDALFTIYSPILVHLPGTPEGALSPLLDAIVQEVDVSTGLVVWEWHAYGHIPLADSYATPQNSASYDAYHINSIQPLAGDRVLISARDTSAVYAIDRAGGRIVWTLGGKASTFRLGRGARFWFQHDARMLPNGQISMFDDEAGPPQKAPASRGLILALDQRRRTARVVREYRRSGHTSAQSEGSVQRLANGNVFVGFGSTPFFSEFSATGRLRFDASLPQDDGSYRILRFPWTATPRTLPDAAARRTRPSSVSVYASWNGATTVARWQVLAGANAASLTPASSAPRSGFETRIDVSGPATTFAVRALSARGRTLATSRPVSAP